MTIYPNPHLAAAKNTITQAPAPIDVRPVTPADTSGVGPLQLRVLFAIWTKPERNTVEQVLEAVNGEREFNGNNKLAYTTILTVMRNLARRGVLRQTSARGVRQHMFVPTVTEVEFKRRTVAAMIDGLFLGDREALVLFLSTLSKDA